MSVVEFTVPGRPVPAARMTQKGKWTKPNAARYLAYKQQVGWIAKGTMHSPMTGLVAVEIRAYWIGGRPGDADNIAKAVLDGCNRIVWDDDTQVVELHVYREVGRPQRTEVKVWEAAQREGFSEGGNKVDQEGKRARKALPHG